MRLLIDTNILIPLEPTRRQDVSPITVVAAELLRLASQLQFQVLCHPAVAADLMHDPDPERSTARQILLSKYPMLPDPPPVTPEDVKRLGDAPRGTNDWVDHQLLAAIRADSVDLLITEDRGIHSKARRLGCADRVLSVADAVTAVRNLGDKVTCPPPAVKAVKAHSIPLDDPILHTFRSDYPDFDAWFRRCRLEQRQAWIIPGRAGTLAAFCVINHEKQPPPGTRGRVLKLCSFKVADEYSGLRFGELLLKAVFDYAFKNSYEWVFVSAFEKYGKLIDFLEDFGFERSPVRTALGEVLLIKCLQPLPEHEAMDPLSFHIRLGPKHLRPHVPWYVIPILPTFARILFPESRSQWHLFPGTHPFGNAIRKAYLCNSPIRSIKCGSILVFYRSHALRGMISIGVTEDTVVSQSVDEIARVVARRTVYTLREIEKMCRRQVLAILFRQARVCEPIIPVRSLVRYGVFRRPPQSIMLIEGDGLTWLKQQVLA